MKTTVYTIGHSTHHIDEFVSLLSTYKIRLVVDVRTIAKSRHNPQFNEHELAKILQENGIRYQRLGNLGGLRHSVKNTVNAAWRNNSFRSYADYMQTAEFAEGIEQLTELAKTQRLAIMCAEAVPWRCHRSLIGDALLVHEIAVEDIMTAKTSKPHTLTSFAKVIEGSITYPASP